MSTKAECPECGGPCTETRGGDAMDMAEQFIYESTATQTIERLEGELTEEVKTATSLVGDIKALRLDNERLRKVVEAGKRAIGAVLAEITAYRTECPLPFVPEINRREKALLKYRNLYKDFFFPRSLEKKP